MFRFLIAVMVCLAFTAGCSSFFGGDTQDVGGGRPPIPPPPPTVGPAGLGEANSGRLTPGGDPGSAGVGGELLVQGLTILNEDEGGVTPGEGGPKWMARLLDPGDDILSVVVPGPDGTYELFTTDNITEAKLQIEVWVAEDIDGDEQGNDIIVHTVPVQLVQGYVSKVNMSIGPGTVHNLAPGLIGEADAIITSIVVNVERSDGNGEYDELFALFPDGLLYIDDDNDDFIEPGEDNFREDANRNGWADSEEESYNAAGMFDWIYLEARVLSVNTADQTMFVVVDYAESVRFTGQPHYDESLIRKIIQVRKLSYTVLEGMVLPGDSGGQGSLAPEDIGFTDSFLIDDSLVDQPVIIQGVYDGEIVEAQVIFELSQETGIPVDGQF